jgi:hypothetical protein
LLHARIHTTRKAEASEQLIPCLADGMRRGTADDVGIDLLLAVGFVFDEIPLPEEEKDEVFQI